MVVSELRTSIACISTVLYTTDTFRTAVYFSSGYTRVDSAASTISSICSPRVSTALSTAKASNGLPSIVELIVESSNTSSAATGVELTTRLNS